MRPIKSLLITFAFIFYLLLVAIGSNFLFYLLFIRSNDSLKSFLNSGYFLIFANILGLKYCISSKSFSSIWSLMLRIWLSGFDFNCSLILGRTKFDFWMESCCLESILPSSIRLESLFYCFLALRVVYFWWDSKNS